MQPGAHLQALGMALGGEWGATLYEFQRWGRERGLVREDEGGVMCFCLTRGG